MEENDRQTEAETTVPKTGAGSAATATTQPTTTFLVLNFATEST